MKSKFALAAKAENLSKIEMEKLTAWLGWHEEGWFQRKHAGTWQEMTLGGLLAVYNLSADHDGLQSWLDAGDSEEEGAARQASLAAIFAKASNWRALA